ncbi:MAG: class I SAM-dependent methyltransferase [Clostridia bacterium]|nr:class I SAM-dependent methyltransferase [Clostridia bacterium]
MNEKKFDNKGNVYKKGRPSYPVQLFEYLVNAKVIHEQLSLADIGSGTGVFTLQISSHIKKIFAIEPNKDMRDTAEIAYRDFANIISVNGTAESTTLEDKCVDLITVAQAFHWFDRQLFKQECQRILRKDGKVILVWNDRDSNAEIIRDNFEVNKIYCPNFKGSSDGIDFSKESFKNFFEGDIEYVEFENNLMYDKDIFIARNLSSSYSPKSADDCYNKYVEAVSELFNKYSVNGFVKYPYITRCYIGKVDLE